jgi:Cu/Ag efflux protein CusF
MYPARFALRKCWALQLHEGGERRVRMSSVRRFSWLAVLTLAWLGVATTACGSQPEGHPAAGTIRGVDLENRELTIEHGDIQGLMKAMTMTFEAEPEVLEGVAAGQEVDFRVKEEGGRYLVTEIRPAG